MNGTTGNPQPSCDVVLFTASGEQGRALTDDSGGFRIVPKVDLGKGSAAILQIKQDGVDYFQPAVEGHFANLKVYQSAKQVNVISSPLSVLQFQSSGKRLQVMELHALNNASNPPITQIDPSNFVLSIPRDAQIEPAIVSSPDGESSKVPLVRVAGSTDEYSIDFPIKPGLTKYAIRYELPYDSGELVFRRQTQYPMNRVGVIVPPSIRFRSLGPKMFHSVADKSGTQQQELDGLAANSPITFKLSGTGTLAHSFHPLNPGERAIAKSSVPSMQPSSPSQRSVPPPSVPSSPPVHAGLAEHERVIAISALLLAGMGILVWRFGLRRNAAAAKH
jgi:hypothetical protein